MEAYYQGLIDKDAAAVVSNSCAGWETQAQFEVDAFRRVNANLNDLVCESNNTDSNRALVLCTGIFTFGNGTETEEVNIEGRLHFVVNEDGQWLMCGYGE